MADRIFPKSNSDRIFPIPETSRVFPLPYSSTLADVPVENTGAVDALADYYANQGGGTVGTNIFTHQMPANPDINVTFFQYPGGATEWTYGTRIAENVMIQVQTRALTRAVSEAKCYDVFKRFDGLAGIVLNEVRYYFIRGTKAPSLLRVDSSDTATELPVFYCEFAVKKGMA